MGVSRMETKKNNIDLFEKYYGDAKIEIRWSEGFSSYYTRVRTMKEAMIYAMNHRSFTYKNKDGNWVKFPFKNSTGLFGGK